MEKRWVKASDCNDDTINRIAEELNIAEKTVEAHLAKAVARLKAGLGTYLMSLL